MKVSEEKEVEVEKKACERVDRADLDLLHTELAGRVDYRYCTEFHAK